MAVHKKNVIYKIKEYKNKQIANEKGITLVALIITIVVTLILAGVTILNGNVVIPII